ncbi:hypothetical protein KSF_038320 [Reticulibacter mediterranei]|uniref:RHS repeat protein n=1 Tax=Reticulibacter mediterranei TaxID=2778369 RepID=A0A8J3ILM2_9CHLR|nr:hypothetical protein [Reticulibacter mediterranei]GHO93784.1 hypothetical protein KSF_038320 [Reticulibacter mediterranei]
MGYDKVGNVLSRATTQAAVPGVTGSGGNETQNFCYDEQSRLVWASNSVAASPGSGQTCGSTALQSTLGSSYTTSYTYTHLGQLWRGPLNGSGTTEQYLYCNSSHPHQVTALAPTSGSPTCSASGTPDYSGTYDTWGNLLTRNTGGKNGSLSYDAFDEMVRWNGTTTSSSQEEWYLYDAAGNRVLRRSATTTPSGNPATAAATITVYAFGLEEHTYSYSGSGTTLTNTGNTYTMERTLFSNTSYAIAQIINLARDIPDAVGDFDLCFVEFLRPPHIHDNDFWAKPFTMRMAPVHAHIASRSLTTTASNQQLEQMMDQGYSNDPEASEYLTLLDHLFLDPPNWMAKKELGYISGVREHSD